MRDNECVNEARLMRSGDVECAGEGRQGVRVALSGGWWREAAVPVRL